MSVPVRLATERDVNADPAVSLARLAMGGWSFRTVLAAIDLRLFTRLAGGRTVTVREIAHDLDIRYRAADALVTACASVGLLETTPSGYRNAPVAEEFLVDGDPRYCGDAFALLGRHDVALRRRTVDALRGVRPPGDGDSQTAVRDLFGPVAARAIASDWDLGPHRRLLEVGAGSGAYSIELCRAQPQLSATLLDRPQECPRAELNVETAGLSARIGVVPGDPCEIPAFPPGHDLVLVAGVCGGWAPHVAREVIGKCFAATRRGGRLIVCEPLLDADRCGPQAPALLGLRRFVETGAGRTYSTEDVLHCVLDAGFVDVTVSGLDTPARDVLVTGRKA